MENRFKVGVMSALFLAGLTSMVAAKADRLKDDPAVNVRVTEAFQPLPSNQMQKEQMAPGAGQAVSQVTNAEGQMQNQANQAQGTKDQAAAQVQGAKGQSMQQGISETQGVAGQLRQNEQAVTGDMQSMVSSTRVGG